MSAQILNSIAVVLPRYGNSLGGGAETLTKALAEHIFPGDEKLGLVVRHLEVWTTCALDHRTWENALPAGTTVEEGITVRRFPVDKRDLETFIKHEFSMRDGRALTVDEQLDWLASGVNSAALYEHIAQHGAEFDALLFAPYLFSTTFWGALIYPERSVLIPCLHNEHYAYQDVFRHLFRAVRGLIFNASPERDLALQLYGEELAPRSAVVGMGFDLAPQQVAAQGESKKRRVVNGPYLLYSGRKEQGKNLDLLIDCFETYRRDYRARVNEESSLQLVIIGSGEIHFRDALPEGVVDLGFVTEEEKISLMTDALALCQPSVNESFSIVMMEAWLSRTPVIVHAGCAVTRDHVIKASGGLYFSDGRDFIGVVTELVDDPGLRKRLGESGYCYVVREYSWPPVIGRLQNAFQAFGLLSATSDAENAFANSERIAKTAH